MTWLLVLTLIVACMLTLEGVGAERNFSRTLEPLEPREWEQAVLDALRPGGGR
jgi:hypothetical protein